MTAQNSNQETVRARAERLSAETQEGYSFTRFGQHEWTNAIALLIGRGLTDREITAIMLSKWTRWAADAQGRNEGCAKAKDIILFIDDPKNFRNGRKASTFRNELTALVAENFTTDEVSK